MLGASYRGGVKETAFSGVYPTVAALAARGADVSVHDPMFSAEELAALGFQPWTPGAAVDVAILQADHALYREWTKDDLPGVRVVVDGRRALDPARYDGVTFLVVGQG